MLVRAEAFFRRLRRAFSRDEWIARLLNLSINKDLEAKPGLVMIQIDGLGFTQFERAIQKGNMPFLAKLMKGGAYVKSRHYTGLPSNTPAVQGALFYGVPNCVPAFGFKDRQTGQLFNMFEPQSAAAIEERLKGRGRPLLAGGSSYGNIFTGGAEEAHFCVASTGWGSLLKAANPLGVPLTILLNAHIFIRALFLIVVEFVLAALDVFHSVISGKNFISEIKFIPLRVTVCVLLREVIAAGAKIDIARGLPVIHANLAGYDEQAHHRGPTSTFAHWSLRGIDNAIRGIWNAAQRSRPREYDVLIYSDHGQEDATGYQAVSGRSIHEAVDKVFEEKIVSSHWRAQTNRGIPYWRAELLRNKPGRRTSADHSIPELKKGEPDLRVVVSAIGPVGHIYPPQPLSSEERDRFASSLASTAKVPIVMTADGTGRACAWNARGKFRLPEDADKVLGTSHPFFKEVTRDLIDLCHHPDAGELVVLGWGGDSGALTFYNEHGSHAGPGIEETSGFTLLPVDVLPRESGSTITTQGLRDAAFRSLERGALDDVPGSGSLERSSSTLRVMTYNVHGCMGRDGKVSPSRIARIIARYRPDVVALQELDTRDQVHQAEIIAQKLVMTFHFHPGLSIKKEGRGNAILSRFPMRPIRTGHLPRLFQNLLFEPRGAVWVEIDRNGQKIQIINTHLSLSSKEGLLQAQALLGEDWVRNPACRDPLILCGDFNALPGSKVFKSFTQKLKNTQFDLEKHRVLKTLPSYFPLSSVDHVFVGPGIRTVKIDVPKTLLERVSSDHLPLIVDVQIASE